MSLLNKQPKVNVTTDFKAYHKQWRDANNDRLKNVGKSKYYKKKFNLDDEFINMYGEYAGEVAKLFQIHKNLITICPELAPAILNHLGET
tara:strand:- start:255 stop:524 length:270 start_codon:yes stop_codon:yes gene_type:complete